MKYVQKYNIITPKFWGASAPPSTYLSTALLILIVWSHTSGVASIKCVQHHALTVYTFVHAISPMTVLAQISLHDLMRQDNLPTAHARKFVVEVNPASASTTTVNKSTNTARAKLVNRCQCSISVPELVAS